MQNGKTFFVHEGHELKVRTMFTVFRHELQPGMYDECNLEKETVRDLDGGNCIPHPFELNKLIGRFCY